MPYIERNRRVQVWYQQSTAGELNYAISALVDEYVLSHRLSYSTINDVMGVLASVQQEFYRRVAAPYEDEKRAENGEVFFSAPRSDEEVQ